jgi:hypothetical protein
VETMIHYPVPVHCKEGYARLVRVEPGGLELTERLAGEVLSLPLYPELIDREVDQVIDAVTGLALRQLFAALKPGGVLLLNLPAFEALRGDTTLPSGSGGDSGSEK